MNEFLEAYANDTFESELFTDKKHAEEEITKGGQLFKTNKLTYYTLNKQLLKKHLRFMTRSNDLIVHEAIVVLNNEKFIKYIQVNFLDNTCNEESKYKPYIRFYREKIFRTEKCKSNKDNMPEFINVSHEMTDVPYEYKELHRNLFKLIYKIIFNSNPQSSDKKETKPDQFKRRINFL